MDARSLTFEDEFDAVFSNAALHWVKDDPDAPIAGAHRALRTGGRFVGELGGHACVAAITVALLATLERRGIRDAASWVPWYFPTADEYEARLRHARFVPQRVHLIPRPTPLPTGMRGWLETFANPFCAALPQNKRGGFLDEVTAMLKPVLCDAQGPGRQIIRDFAFRLSKPDAPRADEGHVVSPFSSLVTFDPHGRLAGELDQGFEHAGLLLGPEDQIAVVSLRRSLRNRVKPSGSTVTVPRGETSK